MSSRPGQWCLCGLAALLLLQACGPGAGLAARREEGAVAWNGRLVARFDGALDSLGVTESSVIVSDGSGQLLPALCHVEGERLVVLLVLDADRLDAPPTEVRLRLIGLPSLHALVARDGRRLAHTTELVYPLRAGLESARPPTLTSINGQGLGAGNAITFEDELHLVFDGVVDPASVTPAACPLLPVAEGLALTPIEPDVSWSLAGERFDLWLRSRDGGPRLELDTRRLGLRGLAGDPVAPRVQLTLARG